MCRVCFHSHGGRQLALFSMGWFSDILASVRLNQREGVAIPREAALAAALAGAKNS